MAAKTAKKAKANSQAIVKTVAELVELRRERWFNGGKKADGTQIRPRDIAADEILRGKFADMILQADEQGEALRAEIRERPWLLIELVFTVVNKAMETVPFFLNREQADFQRQIEERTDDRPFLLLKGRQLGFTTFITAFQLCCCIVWRNFSGATLANTEENTIGIFDRKARQVMDRLPKQLIPHQSKDSERGIEFDKLGSGWRVQTATAHALRSTTLRMVHLSEAAFFNCPISSLQEAMNAACVKGCIIIYETTANGYNDFRDLWMSGSCHNLFYVWWECEDYRTEDTRILSVIDGGTDAELWNAGIRGESVAWIRERVRFLRDKGLEEEQIAWYVEKFIGYKDKRSIRQEYPCSPDEAFVATGDCAFDLDLLANQLLEAEREVPVKGRFTYREVCEPVRDANGDTVYYTWSLADVRFVEDPDGPIKIYSEPRHEDTIGMRRRCPYVIGGDTAGDGSDYYTMQVLEAETGVQAAVYRELRTDDDLYAEQMLCLGHYYNDAMLCAEINFSERPMEVVTRRYRYRNVYLRDRKTKAGGIERKAGFRTNPQTKPMIVSGLQELLRDTPEVIKDVDTIRELMTFIRVGGSQYEAASGEHDDLVMALAIANEIRGAARKAWERQPLQTGDAYIDAVHREARKNRRGGNSGFVGWDDL